MPMRWCIHDPDIHDLFSSTLANLHDDTHELYIRPCVFLFSLMPRRPLGEHYSTIGLQYHVGQGRHFSTRSLRHSERWKKISAFARGSRHGGPWFHVDTCAYHLKVRDRPTQSYKWGAYPGVTAVTEKYRVVHEINRAAGMWTMSCTSISGGSNMFDGALLDEISRDASGSVQVVDDGVSAFIDRTAEIIPLPVYLERASESETRTVIARLGHCIRNNAATNIFNRIWIPGITASPYGRVYLFDYDAVEEIDGSKDSHQFGPRTGRGFSSGLGSSKRA